MLAINKKTGAAIDSRSPWSPRKHGERFVEARNALDNRRRAVGPPARPRPPLVLSCLSQTHRRSRRVLDCPIRQERAVALGENAR